MVGGAFLGTDVITQDGITKAVSFQQVNPDQLESKVIIMESQEKI